MKIRRLRMKNFRSVANGEILFPGHTAVIGGNSVGKSTMCEALDLCLGPDRLSRSNPVNEHDFYQRRYISSDNTPIAIELEVVLTDLTADLETRFRAHREYWNTETNSLLDENAEPEDTEPDSVIPAIRIKFEGLYDKEEDEFTAKTFFASPPPEDDEIKARVTRPAKRSFGFIYLRALRTGSRALSLERGSLLDIILRLKDDDRSAMWEQTLNALEGLDPPIDSIPQLQDVLDEIDGRVRRFVNMSEDDRAFQLYPSPLTRDDLRKSITLFGTSARSNARVPYWRLGSGVINALVFSLLTFIAELKVNVIFAMEEPEIAIPPHTQRRIVQFLQKNMDQSILTTHSPFVLEQFNPENVVLLERDTNGSLEGRQIEVSGIKGKTYRGNLRRILAESMLGNGVICVEGVSDAEVLYAASNVLESYDDELFYTPLDLSGVTVVHCEGDGGILRYGQFFKGLGLKTYAFYDLQKNAAIRNDIRALFDGAWELEQTGIEYLLAQETDIDPVRGFLEEASNWDDYPSNRNRPKLYEYDEDLEDDEIRAITKRVLKQRKGSGYAEKLVEMCSNEDLPDIISTALNAISEDLPNAMVGGDADDGDEATEDVDDDV